MGYLAVIFFITILVLLTHLVLIKRELRNITNQLNDYNSLKTRKKIDMNLLNNEIESLGKSINTHIDLLNKLQVKQKQSDNELKKTIANIAHDLRTPLTSVLGFLQMLKNNSLPEEKKVEYLRVAEAKARDLQKLLNDFFILSVVESPDYELKFEYIHLNNILCDELAAFYDSFMDKAIIPTIDLSKEDIIIIGDKSAIKRILENLIVNILKHGKENVTIKLSVEDNKAVIAIINSATNLTDNDVDLMFNKFYISDKSRNPSNENTGLGLSISKSLMEKMGGEIYGELKDDLLHIYCKWNIKCY